MASLPVPAALGSGPFTTAQARAVGVSADRVRGPAYRTLFRGVYLPANVPVTFLVWVTAALLTTRGAVVSHLTALRLYGFAIGPERPVHLSTRTSTHSRHDGITTHRRLAPIAVRRVQGVPVTEPNRTIVDIATKVTLVELVQAAELMIHRRLTTLDQLAEYAIARHLDGVQRVRRVLPLLREGAESVMETLVRLMIVFARLPEPRCNADIHDADGRFVARGDLVYPAWRIVVEYDGWYHERSAWQRQHDTIRRELLEAAGWRVIVISSGDLTDKPEVVRRVHRALTAAGYSGPAPHLNAMWHAWFR